MDEQSVFGFEQDFAGSLRCIPMAVRFKLDLCGIKLSLRQWSHLDADERERLLRLPGSGPDDVPAYRQAVEAAIGRQGSPVETLAIEANPAWAGDRVPPQVGEYAAAQGVPAPTEAQWVRLTALQRFTLVKLSRAKHDNVNFVPALREFHLLHDAGA